MPLRNALILAVCLLAAGLGSGLSMTRPSAEERARAIHLLNRVTFGATEEDVQAVLRVGPAAWLQAALGGKPAPELQTGLPFQGRTRLQLYQLVWERGEFVPVDPTCGPGSNRKLQRSQLLPLLVQNRLLRAVTSPDQVREVLTEFWFNHFNVDFRKSEPVAFGLASYERDTLAPRVAGRFRDLLGAVAHDPVMLDYLDNTSSRADVRGGLNENYGRELLELHTLGLGAGYTQDDVREVSRCFTGWTYHDDRGIGIDGPRATNLFGFEFDASQHDPGRKRVLGTDLPPRGGEADGEKVLDLVAAHPATARFLARKLAVRFVSDDPSPTLVERVAARFQETDGDLGQVLQALVADPEFESATSAKLKTPLEFLAGALRVLPPQDALLADLGRAPDDDDGGPDTSEEESDSDLMITTLQALGSPYTWAAPTGWPDRPQTWSSTANVQGRLLLATMVAERAKPLRGTPEAMAEEAVQRVLLGSASPTTRAALLEAAQTGDSVQVLATALMSPEFQYR